MDDELDTLEEDLNIIDTTTVFKFLRFLPSQQVNEDVIDTDSTQPKSPLSECTIKIEHSSYTDIDSVGLQVWNGALLLADYIVHTGNSIFCNKTVLELASGTALVSIVASMYCANVITTDINEPKIFETIQKNIADNSHLLNASVSVKVFDFFDEWTHDIEKVIEKTDIILASEVIYDNSITDAFLEQLIKILRSNSKLIVYLTVEKRFIFCAINLRVEAKHYEYFFERIREKIKILKLNWKIEQIKTDFPQYFENYQRCKELELWRISCARKYK